MPFLICNPLFFAKPADGVEGQNDRFSSYLTTTHICNCSFDCCSLWVALRNHFCAFFVRDHSKQFAGKAADFDFEARQLQAWTRLQFSLTPHHPPYCGHGSFSSFQVSSVINTEKFFLWPTICYCATSYVFLYLMSAGQKAFVLTGLWFITWWWVTWNFTCSTYSIVALFPQQNK